MPDSVEHLLAPVKEHNNTATGQREGLTRGANLVGATVDEVHEGEEAQDVDRRKKDGVRQDLQGCIYQEVAGLTRHVHWGSDSHHSHLPCHESLRSSGTLAPIDEAVIQAFVPVVPYGRCKHSHGRCHLCILMQKGDRRSGILP